MRRSAGSPSGGPTRRVLLLLNPGAGRARALRHAQLRIEEHHGLQVDLIVPDPNEQRTQFDQARAAVEEGVDVVVVCGGDGMVSAGVNLVALRGIPLGIIPAGSGNDFARAAGMPRRDEAALQRVLHALSQPQLQVRAVDALRLQVEAHGEASGGDRVAGGDRGSEGDDGEGGGARGRWVANSVNIGFDARVNQRANAQRRTPRQLRYLVALAQEVPRFAPMKFDAEFDDAAVAHLDSALVCIQNGATIGGGIPLAPGARIDDGWAEVSQVAPLSRAGLLALFPLLMLRMHRWLTPLTRLRARSIRIRVPAGAPVFADGDQFLSGEHTGAEEVWVSAELVPGAVKLLG